VARHRFHTVFLTQLSVAGTKAMTRYLPQRRKGAEKNRSGIMALF
jgi:hypothetical protein